MRRFCFLTLLSSLSLLTLVPSVSLAGQSLNAEGSEFLLIGNALGDQIRPAGDVNASGGYIVWEDNSVSSLGSRIRLLRVGSGFAPQGAPLTVSSAWKSKATGNQEAPSVAVQPDGSAVVAWVGGTSLNKQAYARFLRSDGTFAKSDVRVSPSKHNKLKVAAASLANGEFILVWSSFAQDGSLQGIYGRRFSASGTAIGAEFLVNQFTGGNQRDPAVVGLSNGGFVIAWVSELQRGSATVDIYARVFDSVGVGGPEFPINPDSTKLCANPALAAASDGGYGLTWSQRDVSRHSEASDITDPTGFNDPFNKSWTTRFSPSAKTSNSWDVCFSANGSTNDVVRINATTYGDQYGPKITSAGTGFFIVWTSLSQSGDDREGVFGRLCTATGGFEGDELHVNTTTPNRQYQPTVISNSQNGILTVWSGFVVRYGIDLQAQPYSISTF